ncbi:hypothetical protein C8J34_11650 [Rhizobium sp. PP-F2F-G36]|nr:hypothetical protein C8J34_11650 [Rhizobium sp. PP-F2F-G36]
MNRRNPLSNYCISNRQPLYDNITRRVPRAIDPKAHTMGPDALKAYKGSESRNFEPTSKKLTNAQRKHLLDAAKDDWTVRVFGAYRDDINVMADKFGCVVDEATINGHERPKIFNERRQVSCIVHKRGIFKDKPELWFFVFPSKQYVDQVGELIDGLLSDFTKSKKTRKPVEIIHFPALENTVANWTGFSEGVKGFVRNGDAVGIGNVDVLDDALSSLGFVGSSSEWVRFGLKDMFGYKVLANRDGAGARLVLVGVSESFWGQASAYYVKALLEAGARHILYGSKASTLVDKEYIHQVVTPSSFYILNDEDAWPRAVGERCDDELIKMMSMLGIKLAGSAITVPTVMGEDQQQAAKYQDINPSCMDCEDGHIAAVVAEFNTKMARLGYSPGSYAKLVAIHFVTDYIYRKNQNARHTKQNLAVRPPEEVKKEAYDKIGRFMGLYTLRYGLRDQANFPPNIIVDGTTPQQPLSDIIENWRPLLDYDRGQEAISALLAAYRDRTVGPDILIAIAMIAQKCGYTDIYLEVDAKLHDPEVEQHLSREDKLRRDVIRVKYLTQRGCHGNARHLIDAVRTEHTTAELRDINQVGAFYRRIGVVDAAEGNASAAEAALYTAVDLLGASADPHYDATNKLFSKIIGLRNGTTRNERQLQQIAQDLSDVRRHYYALASTPRSWWQISLEKSATAALFVEAAYFLTHPATAVTTRGNITLLIAHLLNSQFGGQEGSETFGEIVNAIVRPEVRLLVGSAMRKDAEGQARYLEQVRNFTWSLKVTQGALKILALPLERREDAIRNLLELSYA